MRNAKHYVDESVQCILTAAFSIIIFYPLSYDVLEYFLYTAISDGCGAIFNFYGL